MIMARLPWHLGDVLRKARDTSGLTIKELARRARVNKGTISALETKPTRTDRMKRRTLQQIARSLGYRLEDIEAELAQITAEIGEPLAGGELAGEPEGALMPLLRSINPNNVPDFLEDLAALVRRHAASGRAPKSKEGP